MSNHIVEWRYFISDFASKLTVIDNDFMEMARVNERECLGYAMLNLRAKIRDLKLSVKNLFKWK